MWFFEEPFPYSSDEINETTGSTGERRDSFYFVFVLVCVPNGILRERHACLGRKEIPVWRTGGKEDWGCEIMGQTRRASR